MPFFYHLSSLTQLSEADFANHTHQLSAEPLIRSDNLVQQHPYFYMSCKIHVIVSNFCQQKNFSLVKLEVQVPPRAPNREVNSFVR